MKLNPLTQSLVLLLPLFLAACSGFQSDVASNEKKTFDTKSCEYESYDGNIAQFEKLKQTTIKKISFGRSYNSALLEGILTASAESTVNYIKQSGVQVYKSSPIATSGKCSRPIFSAIEEMPQDISEYFQGEIDKAIANEGVLLGVYLTKDPSEYLKLPSVKEKPAIVVRENSSRWSLLHEYMHHLLQTQSREQGLDIITVQKDLDVIYPKIETILNDPETTQDEKLNMMLPVYKEYADLISQVVLLFPLEEVAIEVALKELSAAGKLDYAPESSNEYIQASANKAIEMVENVLSLGITLMEHAALQQDALTMKSLAITNKKLSARDAEIAKIGIKYQQISAIQDGQLASTALTADKNHSHKHHSDCSHDHVTEKSLEISRRLKDLKF